MVKTYTSMYHKALSQHVSGMHGCHERPETGFPEKYFAQDRGRESYASKTLTSCNLKGS